MIALRLVVVTTAVLAGVVLVIMMADARAVERPRVVHVGDGSLIRSIRHQRALTHACQDAVGRSRSRVGYAAERSPSLAFRKWAHRLWNQRAQTWCRLARSLSDPRTAIRAVFGKYASQALSVSYCETGGTYSTRATNGQYWGLFQMGEWERATYGHGASALAQARAAWRYFVASGRDWSPWECKP